MAKKKAKRKTGAKSKKRKQTKAKRNTRPTRRPKAKPNVAAPAARRLVALPSIEVETTSGGRLSLASLKGKNVVLYFYPKDDTPGCTTEGCDIRDHFAEFQKLNAVVYGVSRDGVDSHERFKAKFGFPFELIADPDEKLCRAFGVIRQKSLYGRTYMGVDRSTFIFDKTGALRQSFRGVKVPGHVDQLLDELRKL
jgi:peroxiredoxin Q/BCP